MSEKEIKVIIDFPSHPEYKTEVFGTTNDGQTVQLDIKFNDREFTEAIEFGQKLIPSIIVDISKEITKLGGPIEISSTSETLFKYLGTVVPEDPANTVMLRNPWLIGLCIVVTGIVWVELGPAAGAAFGAWNADIIS